VQFKRRLIVSVILLCSLTAAASHWFLVSAQEIIIKNGEVIAMVKEKFDDATILEMIKKHKTKFDLSVPALIELKQAGVSQPVLQAMIAMTSDDKPGSQTPVAVTSPASTAAEVPDEIGVYLRQKDKLLAIEPEIVNWQTGGVMKHAATLGLDREHVNGTVAGPHSRLTVSSSPFGMAGPVEFIIKCPDGNSASEYQLLRFWEKSDRREFRSVTGGVFHASSGAKNNVIAFQFEKIAPRTYKVALPSVEPGEFGFLAPGMAASSDMASRGKIYTFRIIE
jgi:hypothetical protein